MNKGVVIATCMVDQTSLKFPPLANKQLSHHDGASRDNSPLLASSTTTTSIPSPFNRNNMGALLQDSSFVGCSPTSNFLEPRSLNYPLPARGGRTKPSRKTNKESGSKELLPSDGTVCKLEETSSSPPPDSTTSLHPDVMNRAANLRTLLRSAKIPQLELDDSSCSGRRPSISVDIWQAAMISTPRDRLRHGEFPNWHVYGSSDSPFYQHLNGLSASTSSLSGKETLLSSSLNSSHENSLGGGSRSCSPPSSDKQYSHSRLELSPPSTANNARYLLRTPNDSQQEVLKAPSMPKPPRTSPSNVGLIARITNLHQTATKSHINNQRRPNTATGTTEPTIISKAVSGSPKPGAFGRSTPCPKTAIGVSGVLMSSLSPTAATKVTASPEFRSPNLNIYKRPATANCPGSTSASASSFSHDLLIGRPFPITPKLSASKNNTGYVPTLPPIQGRGASDKPVSDRPNGSPPTMSYTRLQQESHHPQDQTTPIELAAPAYTSPVLPSIVPPYDSAPDLMQSVSSTGFTNPASPSACKRNGFYSATPLAITSDRLTEMDAQRAPLPADSLRGPPEDFHSKSRYLTVSVSPPPSSATLAPGQKISVQVRLSAKAKLRKYTSISLVLVGSTASESDSHTLGSHDFLRHSVFIHPTPADEVRPMSPSGDPSEWHVELTIPAYANCPCSPGPLPVPSTGSHATGNVSYSLQLLADRKQLLSNSESLSIKLHVATPGEARYQVTTQPFKTQGRKGRIPFAGGYLGAVEDLTLSHQVYYQSADRLRVGYQFELRLSSNSFLPPALAEDVSKATKVQVHQLIKEQSSKQPGLKFTDHRSKVVVMPSDDPGHPAKWIVKGFLEFKAVSQQMKNLKSAVEGTPRTPRRAETSGGGGRSLLSSSHGSQSPPMHAMAAGLQQETERQTRLNSSQLFLTASIDHCPALFPAPIELSSLIGPLLLSPCPLRLLGDEIMKRAVMAEKMSKVQEEHSKNRK